MGKLIVIEGLDGSGKATQTELITEYLHGQGKRAKKVSFPDYDSNSSALVKMYLKGEFGTHPDDVNAYAASSFYAVDRYASFMKNWRDDWQKGIVIADRYVTSNAIHQCSKLPDDQWDSFLDWLFDFEYNKLGIPEPNMVIYLSVDPIVSQQLLAKRYHGDMKKEDIHEKDQEYLRRCRRAAEYCAKKLGWVTVECSNHGLMLDIDEIQRVIKMRVEESINGAD